MKDLFRREWGAVTFVATVLVGAIAVAISLIVAGAKAPPTPPLASCPSYTPYVGTPTPSPAASGSTSTTLSTSSSATPSPTAFNPALANCPTPPLPPSSTPAPTTSATTSSTSAATSTATSSTSTTSSATTSHGPTPVP